MYTVEWHGGSLRAILLVTLLLNHSLNFSYVHEASDGIEAETEFIYDLELPADFLPNPLDGEVSEYHLWDMEKVNGLSVHEI